MNDITPKLFSLRTATAEAIVTTSVAETMVAIRQHLVPKGNIFEMSKAAALLAVKKTSDLIPDCHPIPIEGATVTSEIDGLSIVIRVSVKTVYKTGVEVEAMHGASVAALTMYDMLKPLDNGIEIRNIRLLEKTGGKSSRENVPATPLKAAVIVCSDSRTEKTDRAGKLIVSRLEKLSVDIVDYVIIPDNRERVEQMMLKHIETDLLIFTGGTGLSSTDITPDVVRPFIEKEIPGIMEAARAYGMSRTPYSMLSRGVAGIRGKSLVLTLPGSEKAATEYMDALFPHILHVFSVMMDKAH